MILSLTFAATVAKSNELIVFPGLALLGTNTTFSLYTLLRRACLMGGLIYFVRSVVNGLGKVILLLFYQFQFIYRSNILINGFQPFYCYFNDYSP